MARMSHMEETEFEILLGEFIKDHNMTIKEIEQFQEDMEEIINNVCDEKMQELEEIQELEE
jgi:hypothetical protein